MTTQTQVRKIKAKKVEKTVEAPPEAENKPKSKAEAHDKAVAEIDELLDEIDSVLEDEAFVSAFIQAGGE